MADIRHLTDARSAGTVMGQSATDKIAFFGATPIVRPSIGADIDTAAADLNDCRVKIGQLEDAMKNLGLAQD